jgi:hypothetical protein
MCGQIVPGILGGVSKAILKGVMGFKGSRIRVKYLSHR